MKLIILTLVLVLSIPSSELNEIRVAFKDASENKTNAKDFYDLVKSKEFSNNAIYEAYDGASETILSKYLESSLEKLEYFKNGAKKIEKAVSEDSNNIEIRFVRFVIQINAPGFLNYDENIDEDKAILLEHYSGASSSVQKMIQEYASLSDAFSEEEKNQLN